MNIPIAMHARLYAVEDEIGTADDKGNTLSSVDRKIRLE